MKNTLATIQSLARQTFRNGGAPGELRGAFEARLRALSNTHDMLTESSWEGACLRGLLEKELAPYETASGPRVSVDGPSVHLTPRAALTLGMTFHELATNAAKYGALSTPDGRIEIGWTVEEGRNGAATLSLLWRERDGPPVSPPAHRGFGSRLIQHGVAHDLGGQVRTDFDPSGLECRIDIPLPADPWPHDFAAPPDDGPIG